MARRPIFALASLMLSSAALGGSGHALAPVNLGALAYMSGRDAIGDVYVQQANLPTRGNVCVTMWGQGSTSVIPRHGNPHDVHPAPSWQYEEGCGDVAFVIDPTLGTAQAEGVIASEVHGTLDEQPITQPSSIRLAMTWTSTSQPFTDGHWRVTPPPPYVSWDVEAEIYRTGSASGTLTSAFFGDASTEHGGGETYAGASWWFGAGVPCLNGVCPI